MNNQQYAVRLRELAALINSAASALEHGRFGTVEKRFVQVKEVIAEIEQDRNDMTESGIARLWG